MNIPKTFKNDLSQVYDGIITIDQFIRTHEYSLRGLARYALRYRTQFMCSDEDDLFQEACIILVNAIWQYDDESHIALAEYVIYNIGARLKNLVRNEKSAKRHPDPNTSRKQDIWSNDNDEWNGSTLESRLPSHHDLELELSIRESFHQAEKHLSETAQELMFALAETNGNFAESVRTLASSPTVRKKYGSEIGSLKYALQFKVLPEISEFLNLNDII